MKEEPVSDELLRQYLLGKVDNDEQELIENLFLTDSQTKERMLTTEQDLIEDYLEDCLTTPERESFVLHYAQTTEQRQKLRITKSIKNWATATKRSDHQKNGSPTRTAYQPFLLRPSLLIPIVATVVIVIIVTAFFMNARRVQREHAAIEQELAQLNSSASLREVPAQMVSLELQPVTLRSSEQLPDFKLREDIRYVELHLPWLHKERYATYQVHIRRLRDNASFAISSLEAETVLLTNNSDQVIIRIRLPKHILSRGQYLISLGGANGSGDLDEEYAFEVSE